MVKRKRIDNEDLTVDTPLIKLTDDGTAAAPSITWTIDPDTGLYRITSNSLGLSIGGTLRLTFNTGNVTSTVPLLGASGTVAAPSISFSSDPDSGIYSISDNTVGISAGSSLKATITNTGFSSTNPISTTNSTDSSSSSTGSLITTGGIGCGKKLYVGDALFLPTTGGTATGLNYYEVYSHSTTWSGIWASPILGGVTITKVNNWVMLNGVAIIGTATTASFITMDTALPARFCPANDNYIQAIVRNNGASSNTGTIEILTTGVIKIYLLVGTNPESNFTGTGSSGFYTFGANFSTV